jgi:hypothetical protein
MTHDSNVLISKTDKTYNIPSTTLPLLHGRVNISISQSEQNKKIIFQNYKKKIIDNKIKKVCKDASSEIRNR